MVATTTDLQPGPRHGSGSQTPVNNVPSSPPPLASPIDPSHYTCPGHTLVAAEHPTSSDFCKARTQTETFQHSVISAISGLRPYEAKGWEAVERALDEFDKQEVGAYKEDIDTLLVFAGLYSAVLTAFVIESYPLLQEDTASESLQVLRFIANQTSNSASSMGFPSSPSFTPNPAAIRVNVLWFASLVLSLSTASLAIFVKQWLREYMAFSTSSAQGKLRVREFRRAGLEVWRVFGIASILPLLLQLSLLLFFVGLCYFTGNVHPSVANATLPLVCAWGFLITCVTTASIFSARCPYTTPGLRPLTTFIRVYIYSPLAAVVVWRYRLITTSLVDTVNSRFHDPEAVSRVILTSVYIAYAIITLPYHIIMFLLLFMIPIQDGPSYAELTFERPLEEADIVRDESKDLDVLVKADNLQANDELLGTTMKAALEQSKPTWDRAVEFLLDVIRNRMPLSATARISDKPYPLDLHPLPAGARQAVANMFTSHVMDPDSLRSIRRMSTSSNEEVQNAISWVACLATSLYRDYALSDIPQTHSRFLLEHIVRTENISDHFFLQGPDYHRTESMNWVLSLAYQVCRDTDDMTLPEDLATLVSLMLKLKQARSEFGVLSDVASDISLGLSKTDGPTLHEIFEQSYRLLSDPSLRDVVSTSRGLTTVLCDIIMMFTNTPSEVRASPWLFDHFSRLGYALCTVPLQNLDPLSSFLAACIQSDSNYSVESLRQPTSMIWSLASINFDETVTSHLESAIMALPQMVPGLGTSEILVLCSMMSTAASNAACVLTEVQTDQSDAKDIVGCLRRIFDLLGSLLWKLDVLDRGLTSAEEFLIGSCWERVQAIEAAQARCANRDNGHSELCYERWAQDFEEATAAVGDDFCLALIRLLIDNAVSRNHSHNNYVDLSHSLSWRPRRLKALVNMGAYATIARAEKQRREESRPNQRGDGVKPRRKDPFEVISIITDPDD